MKMRILSCPPIRLVNCLVDQSYERLVLSTNQIRELYFSPIRVDNCITHQSAGNKSDKNFISTE